MKVAIVLVFLIVSIIQKTNAAIISCYTSTDDTIGTSGDCADGEVCEINWETAADGVATDRGCVASCTPSATKSCCDTANCNSAVTKTTCFQCDDESDCESGATSTPCSTTGEIYCQISWSAEGVVQSKQCVVLADVAIDETTTTCFGTDCNDAEDAFYCNFCVDEEDCAEPVSTPCESSLAVGCANTYDVDDNLIASGCVNSDDDMTYYCEGENCNEGDISNASNALKSANFLAVTIISIIIGMKFF